jgi:hypothetical protein
MPKEVLPIDSTLVDALRTAKANADAANKALTEAQYALYEAVKAHLPEKGTTHFEGIKIATGFYEKWDTAQLTEIQKGWTANIAFPFKIEYKADGTALKYVRENAPSAYETLTPALTLTEKKPTFELVD